MSRSLNAVSRAAINAQRNAQAQPHELRNGARAFHGSFRRQAILMPAMSPLMNEGTITRWKKQEGEAFAAGDVLLQIESDIAMIDVEAHAPGILGKILLPDGTTNVPVEQVIALVARDAQELETLQASNGVPTPPLHNPIPSPPSASLNPTYRESGQRLRPPPIKTTRTLSQYELQTMGHSARALATAGMVPSPLRGIYTPEPQFTGPLSAGFKLYPVIGRSVEGDELDGAAIRRKILANLISNPSSPRVSLQHEELIEYSDQK